VHATPYKRWAWKDNGRGSKTVLVHDGFKSSHQTGEPDAAVSEVANQETEDSCSSMPQSVNGSGC